MHANNETVQLDTGNAGANASALVAAANMVASIYSRAGDADCSGALLDALATSLSATGVATLRAAETDYRALVTFARLDRDDLEFLQVERAKAQDTADTVPSPRKLGRDIKISFAVDNTVDLFTPEDNLDHTLAVLTRIVEDMRLRFARVDPDFLAALRKACDVLPEKNAYDVETLARRFVTQYSSPLLAHVVVKSARTGAELLASRIDLAVAAFCLVQATREIGKRKVFLSKKRTELLALEAPKATKPRAVKPKGAKAGAAKPVATKPERLVLRAEAQAAAATPAAAKAEETPDTTKAGS